jgi:hypothetical protein
MKTREKFIREIIEDITEGMEIPILPNEKRMNSIINRAIEMFKENDERVVQQEYLILRNSCFETPLFKSKRQVELGTCIRSVTDLRTIGGNFYQNEINPDFMKTNYNYIYSLRNPNEMITAVVNSSYSNFLKNFVLKTVSYSYSQYTGMLTIEGRNPQTSLVAEVYVYIPEESIFMMIDFFEYVAGQCQMSFGRIYNFTDSKRVGSINLNINEIKADGKDRIDAVKEKWNKQLDSVDFWIEDY